MLKLPIYLDNNATTPMDPRVLEAMTPIFYNILGMRQVVITHLVGRQKKPFDYAREQVAKLIGADPKEIIFTSGATEGDNLGIKGYLKCMPAKGNHIITATTEHKAVLDTCKHMKKVAEKLLI
jgi:cysteine desulfurase